jgi:hypothetical protein
MNVEKTIEFILGMQAKREERWAKATHMTQLCNGSISR